VIAGLVTGGFAVFLFSYTLYYVVLYVTESTPETPMNVPSMNNNTNVPEVWHIGLLFSATVCGVGAAVFGLVSSVLLYFRKAG